MAFNAVRWAKLGSVSALALLGVAQLVPYGRNHENPPVVQEPVWNSPETRKLAVRACFDCHSNETRWPWYSKIAPSSWLVQSDVDEGRQTLNFSEWQKPYEAAHEASQSVLEKDMPPWIYVTQHAAARLSDAERNALSEGLRATMGGSTHSDDD